MIKYFVDMFARFKIVQKDGTPLFIVFFFSLTLFFLFFFFFFFIFTGLKTTTIKSRQMLETSDDEMLVCGNVPYTASQTTDIRK